MAKLQKSPPSEKTRVVKNNMISRSDSSEDLLINGAPMYPGLPRTQLAEKLIGVSPLEGVPTSRPATANTPHTSDIPRYTPVSKLESSNTTNRINRTHALTIPRKPVPKSSLTELTTIYQHKPSSYHAIPPLEISVTEAIKVTENTEETDAITNLSKPPAQERSSRTGTMVSTISAVSHKEPGPIYIEPSAQLHGMQYTSKVTSHLNSPWAGDSKKCNISREAHTPTGSPGSSRNISASTHHVYEAHSRLGETLSRPNSNEHLKKVRWKSSTEWVAPAEKVEDTRGWIEDFLMRREEADRFEEEAERVRAKEARQHRNRSLKKRVQSMDKFGFGHKLSVNKIDADQLKGSFEARQEKLARSKSIEMEFGGRREKTTIHAKAATLPRGRRLSFERGAQEELEMVRNWARRSSPKREISPPPKPPPPASKPALEPEPPTLHRKAQRDTSAPIHPAALPQRLPQPKHTHKLKTSSLSRLRQSWVSVDNLREDVKRSYSTSVVPALEEGRKKGKDVAARMGSLGGSLKGRMERTGSSLKGRISAMGGREGEGGLQRGGVRGRP